LLYSMDARAVGCCTACQGPLSGPLSQSVIQYSMRGPALRPYRTRADSLATCHTSHTPNRHSARSTLHCSCNHSTQDIKHIDPCTTQALKLSRLGPTPDVDDTTVRQHDCTTARPAQPHRNTVAQRRRDHVGLSVSTHAHVSEGQRRREVTTSSLTHSINADGKRRPPGPTPPQSINQSINLQGQRRRKETTSRANASYKCAAPPDGKM